MLKLTQGLIALVAIGGMACSAPPPVQTADDSNGTADGNTTTGGGGTTGGGTTGGGTTGGGTTDGEDTGGGPVFCEAGYSKCDTKTIAKICNEDGLGWTTKQCQGGTVCSGGACKLLTCTPGQPLGNCVDQTTAEYCDVTGTGVEYQYCDVEKPVCLDGVCLNLACSPGSIRCKGVTALEQCKDDGSGWIVSEQCADGSICADAKCVTACDLNVKQNTYIGCEYWVVDLDNIEGGQFQEIAAVVSNPSTTAPVSVVITNMAEGTDVPLEDATVPPFDQRTFVIPKGYDVGGSRISPNSFRIKASGPVTVHQFNPLNANGVFSNDASLLLPANSAGKEFLVMSWPQRQADSATGNVPLHGFMTVVAVEKGETTVVVYPTTLIEYGNGIEPLTPFAPNELTLQYGEVLNLETGAGQSNLDLTGTRIISDRRVSVFGGHECANIPLKIVKGVYQGADFCDHIEQQLFPLDTWGTQYVADAFAARSAAQTDVWRIVAGANDLTIQTDPPQAGASGVNLNKGQFIEFESAESFFIVATGPISVGHYLKSSNYAGFEPDPECTQGEGNTGIGDPAFSLAVGTVQYRKDYTVLTPANYRLNYINLMYPSGTLISIDGIPLELPPNPLGLTTWNVHTVEVIEGVHKIEATEPIGATAYGYDCDVSYAYPGGLNLSSQ